MSDRLLHALEDLAAMILVVILGALVCTAVTRAYPAMEPLSDVRLEDADAGRLPTIERVATAPTPRLPEPPKDAADGWTYLGRYRVSGYDICAECCGKTDGITASGAEATVGRTCAANGLPFGTRLWIEGLGERVVEDRGGMTGQHIDVLCADHAECYAITGQYDVYLIGSGEDEA